MICWPFFKLTPKSWWVKSPQLCSEHHPRDTERRQVYLRDGDDDVRAAAAAATGKLAPKGDEVPRCQAMDVLWIQRWLPPAAHSEAMAQIDVH